MGLKFLEICHCQIHVVCKYLKSAKIWNVPLNYCCYSIVIAEVKAPLIGWGTGSNSPTALWDCSVHAVQTTAHLTVTDCVWICSVMSWNTTWSGYTINSVPVPTLHNHALFTPLYTLWIKIPLTPHHYWSHGAICMSHGKDGKYHAYWFKIFLIFHWWAQNYLLTKCSQV